MKVKKSYIFFCVALIICSVYCYNQTKYYKYIAEYYVNLSVTNLHNYSIVAKRNIEPILSKNSVKKEYLINIFNNYDKAIMEIEELHSIIQSNTINAYDCDMIMEFRHRVLKNNSSQISLTQEDKENLMDVKNICDNIDKVVSKMYLKYPENQKGFKVKYIKELMDLIKKNNEKLLRKF